MFRKGDKIGRFTVESRVGSGTIGTVYKVVDASGKLFASKVLMKELEGREWRMRFEREFSILQKCDHPSIVKVYEQGTCDAGDGTRCPYLIMDYVDGTDLLSLKERPLNDLGVDKSTRIIRQAAKALEHAHSLSIVHRDIKPANILVCNATGLPVVIDFGLAKDFARLDADLTFNAIGAKGYSCTHKTHHPKQATYADDVWSLGAVYYFLLTGKRPFYADSEHALILAIESGQYLDVKEANPEVPDGVAAIVRKMLDRGQTADYENCRHLLRDFDRLPMFIGEHNKVFIASNLPNDHVSSYQLLVNKIYGLVNSRRTSHEVFCRLVSSMGRANAELMALKPMEPGERRDKAVDHLTRSFIWLCSLGLKIGVELESAVWGKFPGVCPYCLLCHDGSSKCSKATKGPIDIWRLRDLANESAGEKPQSLRDWEKMFVNIYPTTAAAGLDYLSRKLIEELGEVGNELTKPEKRVALLQETGIDAYAFEVADIFAWICQASTALRVGGMGDRESVLGTSIAQRLKYEICPFCNNAICTCDLELETEERKTAYRFLE